MTVDAFGGADLINRASTNIFVIIFRKLRGAAKSTPGVGKTDKNFMPYSAACTLSHSRTEGNCAWLCESQRKKVLEGEGYGLLKVEALTILLSKSCIYIILFHVTLLESLKRIKIELVNHFVTWSSLKWTIKDVIVDSGCASLCREGSTEIG